MMTKPAAFKATYSDLRFVKSRKIAQIVLEMPLEQADAFLSAFGTPNPAEEKWVAIARLTEQARVEDKPAREHVEWNNLRPSAQAAIRCDDPLFHQFLEVQGKTTAIQKVRWACDVASRSELDRDDEARSKWEEIDEQFIEWKRRRKL
jgi:hypothetical protein